MTAHLARIMRPVLSDACWAAVMGLANAWLQCAVSGKSPARPAVYRRSRDVATRQRACAVSAWKVLVRGAGAEASESTRVKREAEQLPMRSLGFRLGYISVGYEIRPVGSKGVVSICDLYRQSA